MMRVEMVAILTGMGISGIKCFDLYSSSEYNRTSYYGNDLRHITTTSNNWNSYKDYNRTRSNRDSSRNYNGDLNYEDSSWGLSDTHYYGEH